MVAQNEVAKCCVSIALGSTLLSFSAFNSLFDKIFHFSHLYDLIIILKTDQFSFVNLQD